MVGSIAEQCRELWERFCLSVQEGRSAATLAALNAEDRERLARPAAWFLVECANSLDESRASNIARVHALDEPPPPYVRVSAELRRNPGDFYDRYGIAEATLRLLGQRILLDGEFKWIDWLLIGMKLHHQNKLQCFDELVRLPLEPAAVFELAARIVQLHVESDALHHSYDGILSEMLRPRRSLQQPEERAARMLWARGTFRALLAVAPAWAPRKSNGDASWASYDTRTEPWPEIGEGLRHPEAGIRTLALELIGAHQMNIDQLLPAVIEIAAASTELPEVSETALALLLYARVEIDRETLNTLRHKRVGGDWLGNAFRLRHNVEVHSGARNVRLRAVAAENGYKLRIYCNDAMATWWSETVIVIAYRFTRRFPPESASSTGDDEFGALFFDINSARGLKTRVPVIFPCQATGHGYSSRRVQGLLALDSGETLLSVFSHSRAGGGENESFLFSVIPELEQGNFRWHCWPNRDGVLKKERMPRTKWREGRETQERDLSRTAHGAFRMAPNASGFLEGFEIFAPGAAHFEPPENFTPPPPPPPRLLPFEQPMRPRILSDRRLETTTDELLIWPEL